MFNRVWRVAALGAVFVTGCAANADRGDASEEELRTSPVTIELALDAHGKCKLHGSAPRVKYNRVVRLKNVGDKPIAALIQLWDNFGGMPAPEGGDVEPGQYATVKMSTKWWVLNDEPDSREWSTGIECKRGPWSDDGVDFDEVGQIEVYR